MDINSDQLSADRHLVGQAEPTCRAPRTGAVQSDSRTAVIAALVLAVLTGLVLVIQLITYPNHDVAWILWGTREMLAGADFGKDIIEPNPPLAWYLSVPTTVAALALGVPLDWTFRAAVALAAAAAAGIFAWLLRDGSRARLLILSGVAGLALLVLPGREFGQREHLALIATLPYLALVSRRLGTRADPSVILATAIGLTAGLGFALKPYFVVIPALVELSAQLLARRRIRLFRPENLAIGGVVLAYLLAILAFDPDYLLNAVPLANEIYWSFNLPWSSVMRPLWLRLLLVAGVLAIAILRRDRLGILLGAACLGFVISYLVQQKGYPYHFLPISLLALLMVASLATSGERPLRAAAGIAALALILGFGSGLNGWWQANRPGGQRSSEIEGIRDSIALHARNGKFLIVAVHPYPTFPVALFTPARHVSRTNSHWFLPAVAQIRSGRHHSAESAAVERHAREFILHDLSLQPGLVLIDRNSARHTVAPKDFDILQFYLEDPRFRAAWKHYREIHPIGAFRQFVRSGEAAR